jgi:hypothetical protein
MHLYWLTGIERMLPMRNKLLMQAAFYSALILLMIASRRIFGDWADGVFLVVLAFFGILFWLFKNRDGRRMR